MSTDDAGADRLVRSSTPALLGGLADRAEQPGGPAALMEMLDSAERTPMGDLGTMLNGDNRLGRGMVESIFGDRLGAVSDRLAGQNSVDAGTIGRFLPMLAPVVMGVLARRRSDNGLDASGVVGLLRGERDDLRHKGLLAGGGVAAAGAAATGAAAMQSDRVRTAVDPRTTERPSVGADRDLRPAGIDPDGGGGGRRWLWWLLGGIVGLFLLGWLLSQCSFGDAASDVGDAAGDVAEDVGDAADDAVDAADDAVDGADDAVDGADEAVDGLTDDDLAPAVSAALIDGGFDTVQSDVADGVVTLTGTVADEAASTGAEEAAAAVEGVTSVDNQIQVEAADAEATDDESSAPTAGTTVNELLDLDPITFAVNSADITPEGQAVLDSAVEFMTANPDVAVEIGGHTDSDGNDASNQALSQSRAESVLAYLSSNGVDEGRLTAVGYGETQPVADNATDAGKAENRRIEFTIQ